MPIFLRIAAVALSFYAPFATAALPTLLESPGKSFELMKESGKSVVRLTCRGRLVWLRDLPHSPDLQYEGLALTPDERFLLVATRRAFGSSFVPGFVLLDAAHGLGGTEREYFSGALSARFAESYREGKLLVFEDESQSLVIRNLAEQLPIPPSVPLKSRLYKALILADTPVAAKLREINPSLQLEFRLTGLDGVMATQEPWSSFIVMEPVFSEKHDSEIQRTIYDWTRSISGQFYFDSEGNVILHAQAKGKRAVFHWNVEGDTVQDVTQTYKCADDWRAQ